jgi:predicted MFS family arabinose efflux permease
VCVIPSILLITHLGGSWRWVFRILGIAALPYGILAAFLDMPRVVHQGDTRMPTRRLIAKPAMWGLLAIIFIGGATEIGPSGWLPTFVQNAGAGPNSAALSLLLFGVMIVIGRLGASMLAHRLGAMRLIAMATGACAALLLTASVAGVIGASAAIIAALSLLGLGVSVVWPTTLGSAGDRFPQAGATMYALLSAAGNTGCVVGPYVIGVVADRWSLSAGMAVLAVGPAGAAVLAMLLRPPRRS